MASELFINNISVDAKIFGIVHALTLGLTLSPADPEIHFFLQCFQNEAILHSPYFSLLL